MNCRRFTARKLVAILALIMTCSSARAQTTPAESDQEYVDAVARTVVESFKTSLVMSAVQRGAEEALLAG